VAAHHLSRLGAGVARLVRRRPADHRQSAQYCPVSGKQFRPRLLPRRTADLHHHRLRRDRYFPLGSGDLLRLAMPVRRCSTTSPWRRAFRSSKYRWRFTNG
jgi:hypothetical protein